MEWFYREVEGNQENECHNDVDIKRLAGNGWQHPPSNEKCAKEFKKRNKIKPKAMPNALMACNRAPFVLI